MIDPGTPTIDELEWLEADGLGGFASGTASQIRTRRYHGWLLCAATPPTNRYLHVHGCDAWVETTAGRFPLSSHRYAPDVVHPAGRAHVESFFADPWPSWVYRLPDGTRIEHEVFVRHGLALTVATWRMLGHRRSVDLELRPLVSGRDPHHLHLCNDGFRFEPEPRDGMLCWRTYDGVPGFLLKANAAYRQAPEWYRQFLYTEERERGLDCIEDLASPGILRFDLSAGEAVCVLAADREDTMEVLASAEPAALVRRLRTAERRRRRTPSRLDRAADAYLVHRGAGRTVVAGYPWFTDRGRDTFVAMRGLCLATGRLDDARRILVEWSRHVRDALLPSRFVEVGDAPEYDAVDASLWFVIAVHEWLATMAASDRRVATRDQRALRDAVREILEGYARGTRNGIRLDDDGLLAAGEPGSRLTWMDAKCGDWAVTPRVGKPVEVQALWLNALRLAVAGSRDWAQRLELGLETFQRRFWNEDRGALYDVIDVEHRPGAVDGTIRPNQIFAAGGLPLPLVDAERARRVVDVVERELWTPLGLRTLARGEPGYAARCIGDPAARSGAYHQGTVWPWLTGPFVEAWVRVRGGSREAKREARERFLQPLLHQLDTGGLGHLPELADAEAPHTPRGCPFQAWSVGEALRLDRVVLAETRRGSARALDSLAAPFAESPEMSMSGR